MKKYSILIVDDEQEFLSLLEELLVDEGYEVTTALNGKIGIEKIKANPGFSVILSDERMPEMTGNEFLDKAKTLAPEATRVMITAYSNTETLEKAINKGEIYKFLNKPIDIEKLRNVVHASVERYEKEKKASYLAQLFNKALEKIEILTEQLKEVRQEDLLSQKAIPVSSATEEKVTLLENTIEKKDEQISDLEASLEKLREQEKTSKAIEDNPQLLEKIRQCDKRSDEINTQIKKDAALKSKLKEKISVLAEEYESLQSESDDLFLKNQWHSKLFEVRDFILKKQVDHEKLICDQDKLISFYENTLYEHVLSEKNGNLSYQTALNLKNSLEKLLEEKIRSLSELDEFVKLDLYLGSNANSFEEIDEPEHIDPVVKGEPEPAEGVTRRSMEPFLIPYADMMTILFAFFILVVAMSNVDSQKFSDFLTSFSGKKVSAKGFNVSLSEDELEMLTKVKELVKDNVDPDSIRRGDVVKVRLDSELLFEPGKADLLPEASRLILDSIKPYFSIGAKQILVEGHTDDVPVNTIKYPSNWELSSARASRVARLIIDELKYPSKWLKVIGYASFRPLEPNTSDENRRKNRRVEIVIEKPLEK
jgi:chemotaxis protein MotB